MPGHVFEAFATVATGAARAEGRRYAVQLSTHVPQAHPHSAYKPSGLAASLAPGL
ncbi:protein of unknown function [Paraburkholderia kururiensis]